MSELYTSLVRAKQELNGGVLPAMSPIPESARHIIDPAFTPGLGALEEHPEKGLRCPVRGCGCYRHSLARHINAKHPHLGGPAELRRLLSIPSNAALLSSGARNRMSAGRTQYAFSPEDGERGRARSKDAHRVRLRQGRPSPNRWTVGKRNLLNTCQMQLMQRILALHDRLGRSPSCAEARSLDCPALVASAVTLFGSWNNALSQCGLHFHQFRHPSRTMTVDEVIRSLGEYYKKNGTFPSGVESRKPTRTPLIPSHSTILKVLGVKSWGQAMQIAAGNLGVRGGRYGLPVLERAAG